MRNRQSFFVRLSALFLAVSALAVSPPQTAAQTQAAVFPPLSNEQAAAKRQIIESLEVDSDAARPNIVLLFADDLGFVDIGCYGTVDVPTPHIDSIASAGMSFTNAYVTAATCSPSRAGMLSGRYQQRFGFEFNTGSRKVTAEEGRGLDPSAITIADVLKHAGYATGIVGKWHLGTRDQFHPQSRGFDEFFGFLAGAHTFLDVSTLTPQQRAIQGGGGDSGAIYRGKQLVDEPDYLTDAIAREAEQFIESHSSEPFFLYVPFNAVHTPFQATQKYLDRFAHVEDLKRRTYYAMTSAMDDAVGRILESLQRNGLDDNTLVVFSNDNGGPIYTGVQSNGPLRMGKLFLFEGGIRVPLIMRWPGVIPENSINHTVVSSLDLYPTFSRAAGVRLGDRFQLDGVELNESIRGDNSKVAHSVLCWRNGENKAIRKGKWKLIQVPGHVWLFDLESDIGEKNNLAEQNPGVVQDLQLEFDAWERDLPEAAWPPRPGRQQTKIDGIPYRLNI